MFTMGPPLWAGVAAAPPPPAGLTLPYTMTFNYASKAAMLADYEAQGFVMPDGLAGSEAAAGVLMLRTTYGIDTFNSAEPLNSIPAGVKSPYLAGNANSTFPSSYTITLPVGTLAKKIDMNIFTSGDSFVVRLIYTDESVFDFEIPFSMLDEPFSSAAGFPGSPPEGAVYISSISFVYTVEFGGRWAVDNLKLLA